MRRSLLLAVACLLILAAAESCGESDSNGGRSDAGSADASMTVDGSTPVSADASTAVDGGADAAATDSGFDAGPQFDEAGCPVYGGTVLDPAAAGMPATGLVLWLRADKEVATVDGGAVCRWDDVSGNKHSFYPGSANYPQHEPMSFDAGAAAVRLSGDNGYLIRNDLLGIPATSGRTVAVYGATDDTTHRLHYFYQGQTGTPGTYFGLDQNTFNTAGNLEGAYVTNNAYDTDLPTSTAPRKHVLTISSFVPGTPVTSVLSYAVDGTLRTLTRTSGGLGNTNVEDFSGANYSSVGGGENFGSARVGEILVWSRALTTAERNQVEQYFGTRYH